MLGLFRDDLHLQIQILTQNTAITSSCASCQVSLATFQNKRPETAKTCGIYGHVNATLLRFDLFNHFGQKNPIP